MKAERSIEVENLGRIYKLRDTKKDQPKSLVALEGVDLQVNPGELFGLLGPNGAGKTTLIKILTTLLAPTSGSARVAGFDVVHEAHLIRPKINMVSGGESSGYGLLTVRENLWMFSQFYGIPSKEANRRIRQLLEIMQLTDRANTRSADLSTGLRQKMNIIRGFMTDPDVLFLDEPTLGLDVGASRDVREFIRDWVRQDRTRTLLLTTHYMVEADELCDRVAIINRGRVLACDSPAALKRRLQSSAIFQIETTPLNGEPVDHVISLPGVRQVTRQERDGSTVLELTLEEEGVIGSVLSSLAERHARLLNLNKHEPTLEDVFVDLVGRSMEQEEDADKPAD